MRLGLAELTTDHPASSYGAPVLVFEGTAYGPEDKTPEGGAWGWAAVQMLNDPGQCDKTPELIDALERWLRQSPRYEGHHWQRTIEDAREWLRNPQPDDLVQPQ